MRKEEDEESEIKNMEKSKECLMRQEQVAFSQFSDFHPLQSNAPSVFMILSGFVIAFITCCIVVYTCFNFHLG